jgi:hypothetical protein
MTFRLAPMSPVILVLTIVLWLIPVVFLLPVARGSWVLVPAAAFVLAIYAWIWLRFRPTLFVTTPDALEVVWPLKRASVPRHTITGLRTMTARELRDEVGFGMRVGAGGLWGGFGWLWTTRRGVVQMYVSRTDGFVWIERGRERPWLITPERPQDFIRALSRNP